MGDEEEAEEETVHVCAIARPLADAKFTKKILKVVKKGAQLGAGVAILGVRCA